MMIGPRLNLGVGLYFEQDPGGLISVRIHNPHYRSGDSRIRFAQFLSHQWEGLYRR
jgi:hypothetical protein